VKRPPERGSPDVVVGVPSVRSGEMARVGTGVLVAVGVASVPPPFPHAKAAIARAEATIERKILFRIGLLFLNADSSVDVLAVWPVKLVRKITSTGMYHSL
jgi:hypothetical protein